MPRLYHTAVSFNGTGVLFGGSGITEGFFGDLWTVTLPEGGLAPSWTSWAIPQGAPAPGPRAAHSAALLGSQMYVYGGRNTEQLFSDLWVLEVTTGQWTLLDADSSQTGGPGPRASHASVVAQDPITSDALIAVIGGSNLIGADTDTLFVWNVRTHAWSQVKLPGTFIPRQYVGSQQRAGRQWGPRCRRKPGGRRRSGG